MESYRNQQVNVKLEQGNRFMRGDENQSSEDKQLGLLRKSALVRYH